MIMHAYALCTHTHTLGQYAAIRCKMRKMLAIRRLPGWRPGGMCFARRSMERSMTSVKRAPGARSKMLPLMQSTSFKMQAGWYVNVRCLVLKGWNGCSHFATFSTHFLRSEPCNHQTTRLCDMDNEHNEQASFCQFEFVQTPDACT